MAPCAATLGSLGCTQQTGHPYGHTFEALWCADAHDRSEGQES